MTDRPLPRLITLNPPERATRGPHGEPARPARMLIDRHLKGGKLDEVPLTRTDLLRLIQRAAAALEALDRLDTEG